MHGVLIGYVATHPEIAGTQATPHFMGVLFVAAGHVVIALSLLGLCRSISSQLEHFHHA